MLWGKGVVSIFGIFDVNIREQQTFNELDVETREEELRLHSYFESRGYEIVDKRDCKDSQSKDIDFEIRLGEQLLSIEVKADKQMYKTGNIIVEISHNRPYKGRTEGWFKKCEADIICYSDVVMKKGYMLNWKKMKGKLLGEFKIIGFDNPHDIGTRTFGFLIPVEEAREHGFIIEEYTFQ